MNEAFWFAAGAGTMLVVVIGLALMFGGDDPAGVNEEFVKGLSRRVRDLEAYAVPRQSYERNGRDVERAFDKVAGRFDRLEARVSSMEQGMTYTRDVSSVGDVVRDSMRKVVLQHEAQFHADELNAAKVQEAIAQQAMTAEAV